MITRNLNEIDKIIKYFSSLEGKECIIEKDIDEHKYCLTRENGCFMVKKESFPTVNGSKKVFNVNDLVFKLNDLNCDIKITKSLLKSYNIDYFNFNVVAFETLSFRKNKYFQLVILSDNSKLHLHNIFHCIINVDTQEYMHVANGINFTVKHTEFNLYLLDDYLIVENINEINFEDFNEYCRCILLSFGFITGYAPMENGYFFSYIDNTFAQSNEFAYMGDFILTYSATNYKPINTILYYSFKPKDKELLEEFRKIHTKNLFLISKNVFSNLCTRSLEERMFGRAIELILEANTASLRSQGVIYSVVLEILSNYSSEIVTKESSVVLDKEIARKLIKCLHVVAKRYVDDYENSTIKKKIENLNSPTNKDKLLKPFELFKIDINKIDKDIINKRNDFLHGKEFIDNDVLLDFVSEHLYINLKLAFLVNALILKIAGHKGKNS